MQLKEFGIIVGEKMASNLQSDYLTNEKKKIVSNKIKKENIFGNDTVITARSALTP